MFIAAFLHIIPSGLRPPFTLFFYKHKFPSGMVTLTLKKDVANEQMLKPA
jgi:hypothetical protein